MAIQFPTDKTINLRTINKLLRKRSYVDCEQHVLVVLKGEEGVPSTVNVPSKYLRALHIISYRYDVYKHTAAAIQAHSTTANVKPAIQQLAQILQYLDDVRNAYMSCARQGGINVKNWFCPELEYHVWLDYIEKSYHSRARTAMKEKVGVTFEYVQGRQKPDIFDSLEWDTYLGKHNDRFDMCGLEITLGKKEPPVPQAALDLVKAIVNDLEAVNKNNKGKGKGTATGALEAKKIEKKGMKGRTANEKEKNAKHDDEECLEPSIEVKTGKLNDARKQQLVEVGENEDESGTDMLHEENSEGGQDKREMQERRIGTVHDNTPTHNDGERSSGSVWNQRYTELYNFTRNRLIELCNIDIHEITDDESLRSWHQSIDAESPDATEILGHIIILRSISWLEEGNIASLHDTLQTIGKANMSSLLGESNKTSRTQSNRNWRQNDDVELSTYTHAYEAEDVSGQERAKLPSGTGVVESDSDNRTEPEGDLNMDQDGNTTLGENEIAHEMHGFLSEVGEDICMASQMAPNDVEVESESSGAAQVDGTITHVAAELKRRRSSSMGLFSSDVGTFLT
ncbi:hypothetical protein HD554DRAFT_2176867 [Boletus coccyginus]|nr:hypothetical protein HD554DRAFT_2176867 [Boletus coccyginus]